MRVLHAVNNAWHQLFDEQYKLSVKKGALHCHEKLDGFLLLLYEFPF